MVVGRSKFFGQTGPELFDFTVFGPSKFALDLHQAEVLSEDTLQDAELVLVDLFVLVSIQELFEVDLLTLIHLEGTLCEYLIDVLVLGFEIEKFCVHPADNLLFSELVCVAVLRRVYYLGSLVPEQELVFLCQHQVAHNF